MFKRAVAAAVLLALAGCGGQDTKEIKETRTSTPSPAPQEMPPGHPGMQTPPSMDGAMMPAGHPATSPYTWQLPEGWTEAPPTAMRIGNFKITSAPEAECYVALLSGPAGGLDANINRWRRQMGQPELTKDELAALPKTDVLGQQAPTVEVSGSFTGMTGEQMQNYMLLGAVVPLSDKTLFIKMTGPEATVKAEKEHFLALCKSLKEGGVADDAGAKANQ